MGTIDTGGRKSEFQRGRRLGRIAMVAVLVIALAAFGGVAIAGKKKGKKKKPPALSFQQNSQQLIYPQRTTNTVQCGGQRIASGGFELENTGPAAGDSFAWTDGMGPPAGSKNSWSFSAHNRSGIYPEVMSTHAYCYKGGKKPAIVRQTVAVPQESSGQSVATCPKGKVLIGVGWDTDAVPAAVDTSSPNHGEVSLVTLDRVTGGEAARATVFNEKGIGIDLTAIAICGAGPKPVEVESAIGVEESHTGGEGVSVRCPGKKKVVFVGVRGEYHWEGEFTESWATFVTKLFRSSKNTAYAYGFNNPIGFDPTVSRLGVVAYCR